MKRGSFSTRLGFILAASGSAVGLGNIWKFPFEVSNGGGAAFLIMYLMFCFILCFPVIVSEIAIGRKTKKNAIGAFNEMGKREWNFIGKMGVLCGVLILSFYTIVAGWVLGYVVEMIKGNFSISDNFGGYVNNINNVLFYSVLFMFITAFIVSKGVEKGIEKAAKILMPSLILIILLLIVYALTLPNSIEGIIFYLVPDFSQINLTVAGNALGQAFFSLSLGMGMLITYGSYINKDNNIINSAALITLTDVGIAFLAGLIIFPFVFSSGIETEGGPGLIFQVFPKIFEGLGPLTGTLVGSTFFILLSFAAITSTVSLLEVPVSYLVDEYKIERKYSVWIVAIIILLIGVPSALSQGKTVFFSEFITYFGNDKPIDFMQFIIDVSNDTLLPFGGFLITMYVSFIWKKRNLSDEISIGNPKYKGSLMEKYINFSITYVCPLILGSIFLLTFLNKFFGI
ncbi:MAG: sodium-dependent transporter [Cytophagia bacterium]|nr:sodium-dependent transporter [Cytophagia bacterium]